jgi:ATP-binding cassette, subfamily B, heavy metal transporter
LRPQHQTLSTLWHYLWPKNRLDLKVRVILATVFLLAAKVLNVYVPFFLKAAIDDLSIANVAVALPLGMILAYGVARIASQTFGEVRDFLFAKVSLNAQRSVALETFVHLHRLSLSFHLDRQTGGLTRSIERGVKGIQFALSFLTFNIIPTFLEIAMVTVVIAVTFNWLFSAVIFGTIFLYVAFTLVVTEWRTQFRKEMNTKDSEANTKAIDSLLNFETVKYFGNETHEKKRYDESLEMFQNFAMKAQGSISILNLGQGLIIGIGLVIVMYYAGVGVVNREMTVGDFVMLNTYLMQLYLPLNFLGFVYRETKQSLVDMEKMFELLNVNAEVKDAPAAKALEVKGAKVEFKNVNFSYLKERAILKNVSFTIQPGQTVAVVGPSGGGKSTLARLLFRFYDVTAGHVYIDGQDIRDVTQESLRAAIGVVPQDTVLFNDTIFYNIKYGKPEASEEKIFEAARMAKIHDFVVTLPKGYETTVGERGLKLSGGEKQRVAIARTILKSPQILIFDEATSALDSETEKQIQRSLNDVSRNRTTLIIAHRLSTVIDADEILVLHAGEIVERGRHGELLKLNGEYASMWRKQQQAKQMEETLQKLEETLT